jgi:Fic family protein
MTDLKLWNWQKGDWPDFRYDAGRLAALEERFLQESGVYSGMVRHLEKEGRDWLVVELMSEEALRTSEIEGEILNRESVQSSIRRQFGLATDHRRVPPAEQGISELMVELFRDFRVTLDEARLLHWHALLMNGRRDLAAGSYRVGGDPMQVVSEPLHSPKVHFEAPPAAAVPNEMRRFFEWYRQTGPEGTARLPMLTRAGICHLYFVSIHPFEDGNGRIARALSEKSLAEGLGKPALIALSAAIQRNRRVYYDMLERGNKRNEITDWLVYFAGTVLGAVAESQRWVEFLIEKTRLIDRLRGEMERAAGKGRFAYGARGARGLQGRVERRELFGDHGNFARHGHARLAGSCGNGSARSQRSPKGNTIPLGHPGGIASVALGWVESCLWGQPRIVAFGSAVAG